MSRVFSIRTILRQTPKRLVREFLSQLGHADLPITWSELSERDVEPIVDALNSLTTAQFDAVEGVFHTLFDLACVTGIGAIREADAYVGEPGAPLHMPEDAGLYELAMRAWLSRHEVVEHAALIHQVDRLTWWRRRNDLPRRAPNTSRETLARLGNELSTLLRREEGRGRNCTVESFARRGTTYYFAFPDDFVLNVTAHDDDGRLAAQTFRRTFTVVLAFEPVEGALELYAKVPARLKGQLEQLFTRVVFDVDLGEWRPDPAYEPNALRDRGFRLDTDPEDNVKVDVRQLRLSFTNSDRQIILRGDPERSGDVFRMMDDVLNKECVTPSCVNLTLITFCFEFQRIGNRRGSSVTFDVAFPNSCSLRNQRPDRVSVIMKYLTRWGIHVARPAGTNLETDGL